VSILASQERESPFNVGIVADQRPSRCRLERYSWREEEAKLNAAAPQFRTGFLFPGAESAIRIHFIHVRSPHANAVPLLLIPPFPFTNLSLSHLIPAFTDPSDAGTTQPFHLVIPSLPGLGFSDALPNNTPLISSTAELFDTLMKRLDYPLYIGTTAGSAASSPSEIDWKLADHLTMNFSESCLGFHMISPALKAPKLRQSPGGWLKWKAASIMKRPSFGYTKEDFPALQRARPHKTPWIKPPNPEPLDFDLNGFREPNTLAYGLCDSPVGLLLFVLMLLRVMGPGKKLPPRDIITLTSLTWLPGPEATLRFWAHCASSEATETKQRSTGKLVRRIKPKISITVFNGDGDELDEELKVAPRPGKGFYSCPVWANHEYNVISTHRASGRPGLLAWERPEIIVEGARSLAKGILAVDRRMQASEHPGAVLLEQVLVVGGQGRAPADISGTTMQGSAAEAAAADSTNKPSISPARIPGTGPQPETATPATPERQSPDRSSDGPGSGEQSLGGSSPSTVIALNPRKQPSES
jgi:hypothetical protein